MAEQVAEGGDSPSLRAFEAAMDGQHKARKWSRLTILVVSVVGLALAFWHSVAAAEAATRDDANEVGLQAAVVGVIMTALVAMVAARLVRDVAVAQQRWVPIAALLLGGAASAALTGYFYLVVERANAALDEWERAYRTPMEVGGVEVVIAAALGAGAFFLSLRADDARVERALGIGAAWVALLLSGAFIAMVGFDVAGVWPVGLAAVVALVGWAVLRRVLLPGERHAVPSGTLEEVRDELSAIRRAAMRSRLALLGAGVAGLSCMGLGVLVFDWVIDKLNEGAHYGDRIEPGLTHLITIMVVGSLVGLWTHRRLKATTDDETAAPVALTTGGIFDETLAETGRLEVRQQLSLATLVFGAAGRVQYQMVDGGGAYCGSAKESGNWLGKLLLGGRRGFDIAVDDLGRTAMRLRRPFVWWFNRALVDAGDRAVGSIVQKLSLRRRYALADAQGNPRMTLESGWLWRSRFVIRRDGNAIGELARVRPPWYVRLFTPRWKRDADRFALQLPKDASLDDRRLLVGALFLVDVTHYPAGRGLRLGTLALLLALALASSLSPADDSSFSTACCSSPLPAASRCYAWPS